MIVTYRSTIWKRLAWAVVIERTWKNPPHRSSSHQQGQDRVRPRSASAVSSSADVPDETPSRTAQCVDVSNAMKSALADNVARTSGDLIALSVASRRKSKRALANRLSPSLVAPGGIMPAAWLRRAESE